MNNIIAIIPVNIEDRLEQPYHPPSYMQEHTCESCGTKGWIGPRQLKMKADNPTTPVWCAKCAVLCLYQAKEQMFGH